MTSNLLFNRITAGCIALLLAVGLTTSASAQTITLSDEQIENIVKRSYQYIALYNVIQKTAFDPASGDLFANGEYNKPVAADSLYDHTVEQIARPNNDTLYQGVVLDLRDDAVIVEYPAIDSKYAVLQTSSYAHYSGVPLASSAGDFQKPTKLLFYTDRTDGYQGQTVEGIDKIIKLDGDFTFAFLRAMPHQADPARMAKIVEALQNVKAMTLAEFQGKPAKLVSPRNFPAYGETDADVFANNLLEVMQFVFNHTTFDPNDSLDQAVLAAYQPLGVEPGKTFDASKVAKLDGERFRQTIAKVAGNALKSMSDPVVLARVIPKIQMPKGQTDLESLLLVSIAGPIGLPSYQAIYIPLKTSDGALMSSQNDYVLRLSKEDVPPAKAFWSLTLYDLKNGFFIPNEQMKYSVGENAGYQLNDEGGIDIYVSASKPESVPAENWLPINRGDVNINGMLRIYSPDFAKMKSWKTPTFEMLPVE